MFNDADVREQAEAILADRIPAAANYHLEAVRESLPSKTGKERASTTVRFTEDGYVIVVGQFYSRFDEFGTKHQPARHLVHSSTIAAMPGVINILSGAE